MGVSIITALIAFPIIIALILLITKGDKAKQGGFFNRCYDGGSDSGYCAVFCLRRKVF